MARIDTSQLRSWQNGDILPAQDYNQERNLIIEANNDTNNKANIATQTSQDTLERINRLELQPTNVEATSTIQSLTTTLTEGQTVVNLPAPGYLPNTNRVQVFIDGIYVQGISEPSPTSIGLPSPARSGHVATVRWVTELPRIFEVEQINEVIENGLDATEKLKASKLKLKENVGTYQDLLRIDSPEVNECRTVNETNTIYVHNGVNWIPFVDIKSYVSDSISELVDLGIVDGGMFGEVNTELNINGGAF